MRSPTLALVLVVLASPAAAADCAGIADSLLRLRCYDDAARIEKAAPAGKPGAAKKPVTAPRADYAAYPATPYVGRAKLPDFGGRDRKYAMFRTRLRDGLRGGANFAGHLAIVQFGCGTGCSVVFAGDVRTGQIHDFPLGGEDAQALSLEYRTTSRLVVAQWEDVEKGRCVTAQLVWTGTGFDRISRTELGDREVCWAANRP